MSTDFEPSEVFADLFFRAIDHGFGSIEDACGPLTPFVMSIGIDGQKQLQRFVANKLEESVELAKEFVDSHQDEMQMYAIAWDGFVTLHGQRTDAILVEAANRSEKGAVLFCQRYIPGKRGLLRKQKAQRLGNPALIGRPESRFERVDSKRPDEGLL